MMGRRTNAGSTAANDDRRQLIERVAGAVAQFKDETRLHRFVQEKIGPEAVALIGAAKKLVITRAIG